MRSSLASFIRPAKVSRAAMTPAGAAGPSVGVLAGGCAVGAGVLAGGCAVAAPGVGVASLQPVNANTMMQSRPSMAGLRERCMFTSFAFNRNDRPRPRSFEDLDDDAHFRPIV